MSQVQNNDPLSGPPPLTRRLRQAQVGGAEADFQMPSPPGQPRGDQSPRTDTDGKPSRGHDTQQFLHRRWEDPSPGISTSSISFILSSSRSQTGMTLTIELFFSLTTPRQGTRPCCDLCWGWSVCCVGMRLTFESGNQVNKADSPPSGVGLVQSVEGLHRTERLALCLE